jgi:hypothetical protein
MVSDVDTLAISNEKNESLHFFYLGVFLLEVRFKFLQQDRVRQFSIRLLEAKY